MGEENKVLRSELELSQVRAEIERRIAEKDEEFQSTKKNFGKAVESMQGALEVESKGKGEALRMKKKLEADIVELETALEHANAANSETQKVIKKYHQSIRETQGKLEKEQRKLIGKLSWPVRGKLTLPKMVWRRLGHCLTKLIELAASQNKNCLTLMSFFQILHVPIKLLLVLRGSWNLNWLLYKSI